MARSFVAAAAVATVATLCLARGAAADCCKQSDALCIIQSIQTREDIQGECNALYTERDGCWRDNNENNDLLGLAIASDRVCFGNDADCCEHNPWFIVLWIGGTALLIYSCVVCCCIPGACCNKNPFKEDNQPKGNPCCCGACKGWTCCLPNSSSKGSFELLGQPDGNPY